MKSRKVILLGVGFAAAAGMCLLPHWAATKPLAQFRHNIAAKSDAQKSGRGQRSQQAPAKPIPPEGKDEELPRLGLPIEFAPESVVSFSLPPIHVDSSYVSRVRLAVLSQGTLHIFRPERDGKLVSDFTLHAPETEQWDSLGAFGPSGNVYVLNPGIIIGGEYNEFAEHGGAFSLALFYLEGKFRVVFKGDASFMSIGGSQLPEAIERIKYRHDPDTGADYPTLVRVWTWAGCRYRPVVEMRPEEIFSPALRRAIEKVRPKKKKTTKPPEPKPHKPMI